jgi:cytochrome P450
LTTGSARTGHFGYRAVLADPYPVYRRLRNQGPIHWDKGERGWLVTAYDTAVALLKQDAHMRAGLDRSGFVDQWPQARNEALAIRRHFDVWPLFASGTDHARIKGTMRRVYTPALAARIRARTQRTAIALLRHESRRTRFDALNEYAVPIARATLAELLVVPARHLDDALHWSNRLLRFMNTRPELEDVRATARAIEEFTAWSIELCARNGLPPDSVPGALFCARRDGHLSNDEMTAMVAQNVTGALGAIAQLIANGLLALLRQRDAFGRLTADACLGRLAAEEILRFEPPFLLIPRQATDSFDVATVRIAAGDPVGILIGAANRDPARFDTPERIDLTRSRNPHISFGFGPHYCPGAGAARAVIEVALPTLARYRPGLMLACEPPRVPLFGMRWLESLDVDDD